MRKKKTTTTTTKEKDDVFYNIRICRACVFSSDNKKTDPSILFSLNI